MSIREFRLLAVEQLHSELDPEEIERLFLDLKCKGDIIHVLHLAEDDEVKKLCVETNKISFIDFCFLLYSPWNSILNPKRMGLGHLKTDEPLTHYYINSSHNTYLMGAQVYAWATLEGYRNGLEAGGRCLEIDCWVG